MGCYRRILFCILVIAIIDKLIPSTENPHEVHTVEKMDGEGEAHESKLLRLIENTN